MPRSAITPRRALVPLAIGLLALSACVPTAAPTPPTTAKPTTTTAKPTTTTAKPTTTTAKPTTTTAKPTTTTTAAAPAPAASGGAFILRTASNTGVPTGTALTTVNGDITVTTPGTVIDSKLVNGCIYVRANNVTIRRSKIVGSCFSIIEIRDWEGVSGTLIEDTEVDGKNAAENCIAFGGYTARRVSLHNCMDGAKIGDNTTIDDSYIHHLANTSTCHCDGVQSTGGNGTYLRRNNFDVVGSGAAIMLGDEFGRLSNIAIDGNRINGGNFGLYGGWNQSTGTQPSTMSVTNNRFGTSFTYGTHVYVAPSTSWSGNIRESTGSALGR
ncbi:MAG: hypothetical protein ACOYNI_10490 [Acidimicrobiia bacterium]